jgi:hypothetical protein
VDLSERSAGGGRENESTGNCWIIGEHGDRERISDGGVDLIKAQYIHVWNVKAKTSWLINIHLKMKYSGVK